MVLKFVLSFGNEQEVVVELKTYLRKLIEDRIEREMRGYREMLERLQKWRPIFVKLAILFPELAPELKIAIDGFPRIMKKRGELKE